MSKLIIRKIDISLVPNPPMGKVTIFLDSNDDLPKIKYSNGTVEILAFVSAGIVDKNYTEDFFATTTAVVQHNLGKYPSVIVMQLSNNTKVEALITYDGADPLNKLTVEVADPVDFKVICN